jgi:hypothetical protein
MSSIKEAKMGRKKISLDFIRLSFEQEGYTLLSDTYTGNKQKLDYICPIGHHHSINWSKWKEGKRCGVCYSKVRHENFGIRIIPIEEFKHELSKEGYTLIGEYSGVRKRVKLRCPRGHIYFVMGNYFRNGSRCHECKKVDMHDKVKRAFEAEGYILISEEYKNNVTPLHFKCPEGHIHFTTWNKWIQGGRCGLCVSFVSKPEIEVREYVESLGYDVIGNDRDTIINPYTGKYLELDILIKDSNKAIEFNGYYWHSSERARQRDKVKRDVCKEEGIDLMVIHEMDWLTDKNSCKEKIQEFL